MKTRRGEARIGDDALRIRHAEPADYEAVATAMGTPRAQAETLQLPWLSHDAWRERMTTHDANACMLVAEVKGPDGAWAAIALYRKHGFEVEGTLRAYALRDGAYVDAYAMARLHPAQPLVRPGAA